MVAKVTWGAINHLTDKRINDAVHHFGTAAAWPIGEPRGQLQNFFFLKKKKTKDRARRGEQARGNLVHRVAFMEPQ